MLGEGTIALPPLVVVLIAEFWLSGLFILSIIFTQDDATSLEHLNLFMFITLGVGSLVGGYASDYFGRVKVFKVFSALWGASSILMVVWPYAGYIASSGCIGLLNNLTFVLIVEQYDENR